MSTVQDIVNLIALQAHENKAEDIRQYDTNGNSSVTDVIFLITALNKIHCKSLLQILEDSVEHALSSSPSDDFYDRARLSGNPDSGWVVLDFNSIIVHVLTEDVRLFYDLDSLYEKLGTVYHH